MGKRKRNDGSVATPGTSGTAMSTTPNLRVDAFMSHQVDAMMMYVCGDTIASAFVDAGITKVVTVETAGIVAGFCAAMCLDVDLVYARKKLLKGIEPSSVIKKAYRRKGAAEPGSLYLSSEFFSPDDTVLLVDSFLATGHTILTLAEMVQAAGSKIGGAACLIEKAWMGGRDILAAAGVAPVECILSIASMGEDINSIEFVKEKETNSAAQMLRERILNKGEVTAGYVTHT